MISLIKEISAEEVRPLRHRILRPGQDFSTTKYKGDDLPTTRHFGYLENDAILGCCSVYAEDENETPTKSAWRIRGMCVVESKQGQGIGTKLLDAAIKHAGENAAKYIWCNARLRAAEFYQRQGLAIVGDEFDIPGIGPHYLCKKDFK